MSLISDALRKARQEAAERDARARGLAPPPGPVSRRSRAGVGTGLVAGATIAAVAALVGGAAVWWAVGTGGPEAPQVTRLEGPPAAGADVAATDAGDVAVPGHGSAEVEQIPTPVPDAPPDETGGADPAIGDGRDAPPPTGADAELQTDATPDSPAIQSGETPDADLEIGATIRPTPGAPSSTSTRTRHDRPSAPDAGPREYGLVADLGYARLELGYLIYRSEDPFAEVNGREVHVGSRVDGFVVEEITRTSIRLSDDRGPVTLRIR